MPADATFFFDLGSPYAWLAAERLEETVGRDVAWQPVLLGGIFAATGRSSWAKTARRDDGIAEIRERAFERRLPALVWPDEWPNDGLKAMRVATWAASRDAGSRFALAAFRVQFTEGRALSEPDAIAAAASAAGLDPDEALASADDPEVKAALRAATDDAVAAGVFGVPSVRVGHFVVWGDDALPQAAVLRTASA